MVEHTIIPGLAKSWRNLVAGSEDKGPVKKFLGSSLGL